MVKEEISDLQTENILSAERSIFGFPFLFPLNSIPLDPYSPFPPFLDLFVDHHSLEASLVYIIN